MCDANVYKLVSSKENQTVRQCMRHVLSNKIFTTDKSNKMFNNNKANYGVIINNTKPSQQIVQVRGNERLITKNDWSKVFQIQTLQEKRADVKPKSVEKIKKAIIDDSGIDYVDKLIKLTDDEFDELLSNFEPRHEELQQIGSMLIHGPFEKDYLIQILSRWYFKVPHKGENAVDQWVSDYTVKEHTNRWFYSIVARIEDETIRNQWKNKFKYYTVDEDVKLDLNLDSDGFTLTCLDKNNY